MAPSLSADASLTAQVAPADTTAPSAPTGLIQVDSQVKTTLFKWVAPSDKDVKHYHWEVRTASAGGGSLIAEGDTEGAGVQVTLTLNQIAYSTTRYLRIRAHDFSGNVGSYSTAYSFSFNPTITEDIGSAIVTSPKISTGGVETGNVAVNAVSAFTVSAQDSDFTITTSEQVALTVTVSADTSGSVKVSAKLGVRFTSNTTITARLRKGTTIGGTEVDVCPIKTESLTFSDLRLSVALQYDDPSPSASQSYVLTLIAGSTQAASYLKLSGTALKR
jgi:hypothetical protein